MSKIREFSGSISRRLGTTSSTPNQDQELTSLLGIVSHLVWWRGNGRVPFTAMGILRITMIGLPSAFGLQWETRDTISSSPMMRHQSRTSWQGRPEGQTLMNWPYSLYLEGGLSTVHQSCCTRTLCTASLALTTSYPRWMSTPAPTEMYPSSCATSIALSTTDPMIESAVPPSASLVVLAWARQTMSGGWVIMSTLPARFHANA